MIFEGLKCVISEKRLDFGVKPDRGPDLGILDGFFATAGQGQKCEKKVRCLRDQMP